MIRAFIMDHRPTFKASIDAFALMWNHNKISGQFYAKSSVDRKRLNDEYSAKIKELDYPQQGDTADGLEEMLIRVSLDKDGKIPEYEWVA